MRELSCIQYPPQYHTRIICSRSRSYAPMLRDDNAVSAPRPHALHRGPVTQPQCHVLHVVLHRSHEPSCSRLIDTLVLLEHRLLTDARARDERAARPHTVSSFVQRSGAARAPDCSQEVGGASTVGSPAARTRGTMSALAARAVAAVCGGFSNMWEQSRWRHLVDCCDHGRTATSTVVIHTTSMFTADD